MFNADGSQGFGSRVGVLKVSSVEKDSLIAFVGGILGLQRWIDQGCKSYQLKDPINQSRRWMEPFREISMAQELDQGEWKLLTLFTKLGGRKEGVTKLTMFVDDGT
jgi:hypothetical protein